jgi:hypothetical protein
MPPPGGSPEAMDVDDRNNEGDGESPEAMDVDDWGNEGDGESGDEEDSATDGILRDLNKQTAGIDDRMRNRKREVSRTDEASIRARFGLIVGKEETYTCCKQYCLHKRRNKDKPFLLATAAKLRQALALLSMGEQRHMVYELLLTRWAVWRRPDGSRARRRIDGKLKRTEHVDGYAIPEVHNGTQICRYTSESDSQGPGPGP